MKITRKELAVHNSLNAHTWHINTSGLHEWRYCPVCNTLQIDKWIPTIAANKIDVEYSHSWTTLPLNNNLAPRSIGVWVRSVRRSYVKVL